MQKTTINAIKYCIHKYYCMYAVYLVLIEPQWASGYSGNLVQEDNNTNEKVCTVKWSSNLPHFFPLLWRGNSILYPQSNFYNRDWTISVSNRNPLQVGCTDSTGLFNFRGYQQLKVTCGNKLQVCVHLSRLEC